MSRWTSLFCLVVLLGPACGCGGGGNDVHRAAVKGTVTFDGKPVDNGMALFVPESGVEGPPVPVTIVDGKFEVPASAGPTVGRNGVQITATKKTGKIITFQGEQNEEIVQYIPARYNEQTDLKVTVSVDEAENQFEFPLTSQ